MARTMRLLIASFLFACATPWAAPALAQDEESAMLLVAPGPNGGHIGVILNRPTRRSLSSLFPEHEPSKKVVDPVHYGGPFSRGALVELVRTDVAPGNGAVLLMKNLYLAFRANTIDGIIES